MSDFNQNKKTKGFIIKLITELHNTMQRLKESNRRKIFDFFLMGRSWYGSQNQSDFLSDLFDLSQLPSTDARFKDAAGDIWQHTVNNNDWEDNWIFSDNRFNLLACEDEDFLRFLVRTVHPVVRPNIEEARELVNFYNTVLKEDGFEIIQDSEIDSHPVFGWNRLISSEYEGIIKILVTPHPNQSVNRSNYPCVVLAIDHWNDYQYETTFTARYIDEFANTHELGVVKVLCSENKHTREVIPQTFTQLDSRFVSLGQELDYYDRLSKMGKNVYSKILTALNDVVYSPEKASPHLENKGFELSLLRSSGAEKAYREGGKYFEKEFLEFENTLDFHFSCKLPEAGSAHEIDFDFRQSVLPYRVAAVIGKNGTGKTHVISNLANALSGVDDTSAKDVYGAFSPQPPTFSKVIVFSYSIFDNFLVKEGRIGSYRYCGIRKMNGVLSDEEMKRTLVDALEVIAKKDRRLEWRSALSQIIDVENIFLTDKKITITDIENKYSFLSSGQAILMTILSQVIAFSENESLLLFDEPELHLHPNAIAGFIKVLVSILERFKSYAIISTHSPIILREIPSRSVRVFRRQGNTPIITQLEMESFGENFSTISDEIFGTLESDVNYKTALQKMVNTVGYEETLRLFDNKLGLNAKIYMKVLEQAHEEP